MKAEHLKAPDGDMVFIIQTRKGTENLFARYTVEYTDRNENVPASYK